MRKMVVVRIRVFWPISMGLYRCSASGIKFFSCSILFPSEGMSAQELQVVLSITRFSHSFPWSRMASSADCVRPLQLRAVQIHRLLIPGLRLWGRWNFPWRVAPTPAMRTKKAFLCFQRVYSPAATSQAQSPPLLSPTVGVILWLPCWRECVGDFMTHHNGKGSFILCNGARGRCIQLFCTTRRAPGIHFFTINEVMLPFVIFFMKSALHLFSARSRLQPGLCNSLPYPLLSISTVFIGGCAAYNFV